MANTWYITVGFEVQCETVDEAVETVREALDQQPLDWALDDTDECPD